MIYELDSPLEITKLVDMAKSVLKAPVEVLRKRMIAAVTRSDSKIFVEQRDQEIRGFIFGTIEELDGEQVAFIHLCVVKSLQNEKAMTAELVAKINSWAKERGIGTLYFMTRRNPRAFERKYHFKLAYFLMKKEVK